MSAPTWSLPSPTPIVTFTIMPPITLPSGGLGEELKGEAHAQVMEI